MIKVLEEEYPPMNPVYEFCITHSLLDRSAVDFLLSVQERPPLDPLEAVLGYGVDEAKLYQLAATEVGAELLDAADWEPDPGARLSLQHQLYFNTAALRRTGQVPGDTVYATAAFTGLDRLRGALAKLLGQEQRLALVRLSQYKTMRLALEARAGIGGHRA